MIQVALLHYKISQHMKHQYILTTCREWIVPLDDVPYSYPSYIQIKHYIKKL